jgi:hypothetical protein
MKLLTALALILSAQMASATIVKIPLFIQGKKELIPMREINRNLKAQDKYPEFLFLDDSKKETLDIARKLFWSVSEKLEKNDLELASDLPGANSAKGLSTCYTGKPAEAVDLLFSMSDSIFSDQLGLIGWKYKKQKNFGDNDTEETEKYLNENSDVWKNFEGKDESILILSHEGDDGTDINDGLVERCK